MKIIKPGNKIECKCGCVFEYDRNDVKQESHVDWGFTADKHYRVSYVLCPTCGRKTELYSEFVGFC